MMITALQKYIDELDTTRSQDESEAVTVFYLLFEQQRNLREKRGISEGNQTIYGAFIPTEVRGRLLSEDVEKWLIESLLKRLDRDPMYPGLESVFRYANKRFAALGLIDIATRRIASWGKTGYYNVSDAIFEYFAFDEDPGWALQARSIVEDGTAHDLVRAFLDNDDPEIREWGVSSQGYFDVWRT